MIDIQQKNISEQQDKIKDTQQTEISLNQTNGQKLKPLNLQIPQQKQLQQRPSNTNSPMNSKTPKAQVQHNWQAQLELKQMEDDETQEACLERAQKYKQYHTICKRDENGEYIGPYSLCVANDELGQYGLGLHLYFEFVKVAIFVFIFMSLIAIPAMVSNYSGDGIVEQTQYGGFSYNLARYSLANQPQLTILVPNQDATQEQIDSIQKENKKKVDKFKKKMDTRIHYVIVPDIMYTICFLMFSYCFSQYSKTIKREVQIAETLPSNFAIEVTGFPQTYNDETKLKNFFEKFGPVAECKMARHYFGTLFIHKQVAELQFKIIALKKQLQKKGFGDDLYKDNKLKRLVSRLRSKQKEINQVVKQKLGGDTLEHNQYPALKAYIVFEHMEHRNQVYEIFKDFSIKNNLCYRLIPALRPKVPEDLMILKPPPQTRIEVAKKIDEPSEIRWENIDVSPFQRFFRGLLIIVILIGLMGITFTIELVQNSVQPTNPNDCVQRNISFVEAKSTDQQHIVDCYCKDKSFIEIQKDEELRDLCQNIFWKYAYQTLLAILTSIFILIINEVIEGVIEKLSEFERYASLTQEVSTSILQLFFAMFTNTALVILMFNFSIFGVNIPEVVTSPVPPLKKIEQEQNNVYNVDLNRGQFINLGGTKVQRDMNKYIVGSQFNLVNSYAMSLNTIFVTMFYCSGIPILLPLCVASLIFQYWCQKYFLLRYEKKPPVYNAVLNKKVVNLLPYAAVLHLIVGILMYGSPLIFPENSGKANKTTNSILENAGLTDVDGVTDSSLYQRAFRNPILVVFLIILIIILIINATVWRFLKKLLKKCFQCLKKEQVNPLDEDENGIYNTYSNEYPSMSKRMLASYDIRLNEKYKDLVKSIDIGKRLDEAIFKPFQKQKESEGNFKDKWRNNINNNQNDSNHITKPKSNQPQARQSIPIIPANQQEEILKQQQQRPMTANNEQHDKNRDVHFKKNNSMTPNRVVINNNNFADKNEGQISTNNIDQHNYAEQGDQDQNYTQNNVTINYQANNITQNNLLEDSYDNNISKSQIILISKKNTVQSEKSQIINLEDKLSDINNTQVQSNTPKIIIQKPEEQDQQIDVINQSYDQKQQETENKTIQIKKKLPINTLDCNKIVNACDLQQRENCIINLDQDENIITKQGTKLNKNDEYIDQQARMNSATNFLNENSNTNGENIQQTNNIQQINEDVNYYMDEFSDQD